MKTLLALLVAINLAGCATYWDQQDPCQSRAELNRPAGYQKPSWCGASAGSRTVTRDFRTNNVIAVSRTTR